MTEKTKKNRPNIVTIIVAFIITVTMLFYFFTFQVRVTEKAVITTFGKPTSTIDPISKPETDRPGLYWKLPYPFQNSHIFDARMRIFTGVLEQIFTSDGKSIILQTYTGWRIGDPKLFLMRIGTVKEAQANLESFIRSYTNIVVSKHSFYDLISKSAEESNLEQIEIIVKNFVNNDSQSLGIEVEEFGFRRLVLPENTTKEVFNRMKEERNRLAQQYRSEGEKEAQIIKSRANAYKDEQLIIASARAKEIEGQAYQEAEKEYEIFAKEKELAIWLRKLESLKKILKANRSTLLLDPSTAPFDLLSDSNIKKEVEAETQTQELKKEKMSEEEMNKLVEMISALLQEKLVPVKNELPKEQDNSPDNTEKIEKNNDSTSSEDTGTKNDLPVDKKNSNEEVDKNDASTDKEESTESKEEEN